jgi:hypothetical protein
MDSGGFNAAWCWVLVVVLPLPALLFPPRRSATKAEERSVSDDTFTRRNASDDTEDLATIVIDVDRPAMGLWNQRNAMSNLLLASLWCDDAGAPNSLFFLRETTSESATKTNCQESGSRVSKIPPADTVNILRPKRTPLES